jgi:hypothetical protein
LILIFVNYAMYWILLLPNGQILPVWFLLCIIIYQNHGYICNF